MPSQPHAASHYRTFAKFMCVFVLVGLATPAQTSSANGTATEAIYKDADETTTRRAAADSCKTERAIRQQLLSYGFEHVQLGSNISQMTMQAEVNFRGNRYALVLDRCNARLLAATNLGISQGVLAANLR